MTIEQLFEQKRKAEEQARTLLAKEGYTLEDNTAADKWLDEARALAGQITKLKALEDQEAEEAKRQLENDKKSKEERKESDEHSRIFADYLLGNISEREAWNRDAKIEKRAAALQTTTTTAGGYTIPTGWMKNIVQAMLEYGGVYANSKVFRTPSGNDLELPKINDTANKAFQVNQSTDPASDESNAALVFGQQTFKAYKWTSGNILVPYELLQDADITPVLEDIILTAMRERMSRGLNEGFTTGAGTITIQGVVTGATNAALTVSPTAITRDNVLALLHSVDPAYRMTGKFMFNDTTLQAIKKLSFGDTDDRPLWQPSIREGSPETIEGKQYIINQDMADIAASAKSVLFGDFGNYWIREVGDWRVKRLEERYGEKDQVAFLLFARYDGQVVDAGTHPIKYLAHAAS